MDHGTLFGIILVAYHLGINMKNDFTPEEEEEVRLEYQWAFE